MGDRCSKAYHVEHGSTAYRSDVRMSVDAMQVRSLHHLLVGFRVVFTGFSPSYHHRLSHQG